MKDPADRSTSDLVHREANRRKQAAFAARQRAAGRRHYGHWLTEAENAAVVAFIKQLRGEQSEGQA